MDYMIWLGSNTYESEKLVISHKEIIKDPFKFQPSIFKRALKTKNIKYRNRKPKPFFLKNRFNPNFKKQFGKNPAFKRDTEIQWMF